jgi:hypothetical protein
MQLHNDKCFENSGELMGFFNDKKSILIERFKANARDVKGPFMRKSVAYFVVKDLLTENDVIATECQINRLAELIVEEEIL